MKLKFASVIFLILIIGLGSSCSTNSFGTRRNFHSRVKVDRVHEINENLVETSQSTIVQISNPTRKGNQRNISPVSKRSKVNFTENVVSTFYPGLKKSFEPIFKHQPRKLNKVKGSTMDSDMVAGLILGILSLVSAIAAGLMIIGMASGNIWVYFVLGMTFAVIAIVLGAVGKRFRLKGLSIAGLTIGILVVIALLAMLIVFTVLGIL